MSVTFRWCCRTRSYFPRVCRWFCHVDDDNYMNVRTLVKHLSQYPHTQDMYIGKPSLDRPIEATERLADNKMVGGKHKRLVKHNISGMYLMKGQCLF